MKRLLRCSITAILILIAICFIHGSDQWERAYDDLNSRSVVTPSITQEVNSKYGFPDVKDNEAPGLIDLVVVGAKTII